MSKKWGESFLKTGLPLEYLTVLTLRSLGWDCDTHPECQRPNREKKDTWFELDIEATFADVNQDTSLSLLIECKYHDLSRFWFFFPHEAQRWYFNDRVLNCGPFQTLKEPHSRSMLDLAPLSADGIVVSQDGERLENAVYTAVQQLANAFVPYGLFLQFAYNLDFRLAIGGEENFSPTTTALIPMIVTNARIFRLRPNITDLEVIRRAEKPEEIADEVDWTWYYHDPSMALKLQNSDAIEAHRSSDAELIYRYSQVDLHLERLAERPNWIAVANIKTLGDTVSTISKHFLELPMICVDDITKKRPSRRRRQSS